MNSRNTLRSAPTLIVGVLITLVGIVLLLDNVGILYAREYLLYWPAALILIGLIKLLEPAGVVGRIAWGIVTLAGLLLLLDNLYVIEFRLWDLWPLIFILIGFALMRGMFQAGARGARAGEGSQAASQDATIGISAILGGSNVGNSSPDFQGGFITAVMGGTKVDLRAAKIKGDQARLDLFALWGGIELLVPKDWEVEIAISPILGGIEDKSEHPATSPAKRLVITGTVVMGGAEIKN